MRAAILLATFGTTRTEAAAALDNVARMAAARFPGTAIRWAYTSPTVRRKLARDGRPVVSPEAALQALRAEGFTHVAVQSLHIAAGAEYHALARTVTAFAADPTSFPRAALGKPLLVRRAGLEAVVTAGLAALPERRPGDAVVLMGHGNAKGRNDMTFLAAAAAFEKADPYAVLGTVEGQPALADVLARLAQLKPERALLVPFMAVAGEHAVNDLAGPGPESWRSAISALGISCVPVLKGLAATDGVAAVWLEHLAAAMNELEATQ